MYAPIFIVWDETIPQELAGLVKFHLRDLIESFLPDRGIEVVVHLTFLLENGASAEGKIYHQSEDFFSYLNSNVAPTSNLSFELSNIPFARMRNFINDLKTGLNSLPPLVLLLVNRPLDDVYFPDRSLKTLLSHELSPLLLVLGTSDKNMWSLPEDVRRSEHFLAYTTSIVESSVTHSLEQFKRFIETRLRGQSLKSTAPDLASSSEQVLSTSPLPVTEFPHPELERPIITFNAPVDKGAISRSSTPFIEKGVPINITNEEINTQSKSIVEPQLEVNEPIEKSPEVVIQDSVKPMSGEWIAPGVTPVQGSPSKKKKKTRKDKIREKVRRRIEVSQTESAKVTSDLMQDHIGAHIEEQISQAEPISIDSSFGNESTTADGQIVIDHASSLNARPWYSPKWKKLPQRGPSRDLEIDLGSLDDLRVIAGSTRGTKHQYYGDENQDSFHIAKTEDSRYLIISVADGVGSATYSAYGSRFVTYFVAQAMARTLNERPDVSPEEIQRAFHQIISEASDRMQQWKPGDLYAPFVEPTAENANLVSSTLCAAVIPVHSKQDGERTISLACVGDSSCYTLNNAAWTLQSAATKDGELLEHGTYALPASLGEPPLIDFFTFEMKPSDVLVLMTDGIGTSLSSGNTPVGRWLAPRLYGHQLMNDFIHVLDYVQTLTGDRLGEDDDRTLAVVYDFEGMQKSVNTSIEEPRSGVLVDENVEDDT